MAASGTSSAATSRDIVHLIIQRSTIELFDAYGVAVAPADQASTRTSTSSRSDEWVGVVQLSSATCRGTLTMACSGHTLRRMRPTADGSFWPQDWMREVTNQLAGRIKNRFVRYGLPVQVGVPTVAAGAIEAGAESQRGALAYVFRTLTDDVCVTLTGGFESATFDVRSDLLPAEEGDIILL